MGISGARARRALAALGLGALGLLLAGDARPAATTATTASAAAMTAATVTLRGVVQTKARPKGATLNVVSDHAVCGAAVPDESLIVSQGGGVANAVVSIAGTRGGALPPPQVVNRQCRFDPHVLIARPQTRLQVSSDDPILHNTNVYDDKQYSLFNVALPVPKKPVSRPLAAPGAYALKCDVHPWMRGFIIVSSELAAVTDREGRFEIPDVPAGTYDVRVWHETLAPQTLRGVTVSDAPLTVILAPKGGD